MPAFKKMDKKKIGRKLKLNDQLIEDVCKLLRGGVYVETAVVLCDIGKKTFYEWIKLSHKEPECTAKKVKDMTTAEKQEVKDWKLRVKFRNAVAKAIEEATTRDVMNIDKAAMGRMPQYDRYPPDTQIPARDDKGKVQTDGNGNVIYIDVSNQIVCDYKGKPIIAVQGLAPDWKASAWRLEKRVPKDWGSTQTVKVERVDPLANTEEDDSDKITFEFVKAGEVTDE